MTGWLEQANRLLLITTVALLCAAGVAAIWPLPKPISVGGVKEQVVSARSSHPSSVETLASPLFALRYSAPTVQLPNLSNEFLYYGMDRRPDAPEQGPTVHIALRGSFDISSFPLGSPIYLQLEKSDSEGNYTFAPKEIETPLWITPEMSDQPGEIVLKVEMRSCEGETVNHPSDHARIVLPETPYGRIPQQQWSLGPHRADNSLLARLRCCWGGEDRLIQELGGSAEPVHRLDFGDGEETYSCFISPGTILYWDKERWQEAPKGFDTRSYPILAVQEIEDRLIHLEVWNVLGKGHLNLSLLRSRESWHGDQIASTLRVMGARSWSRLILEAGQQRLEVSPDDWLIFENNEWHKLATPEEIDLVVSRERTGDLLVIDGVKRTDGRTLLTGRLYSKSRSDVKPIELQLTQSQSGSSVGGDVYESRPPYPQMQPMGMMP